MLRRHLQEQGSWWQWVYWRSSTNAVTLLPPLVSSYMETKVRFWNAYMLFYKAKDLSCTAVDVQPQVKSLQDEAATGWVILYHIRIYNIIVMCDVWLILKLCWFYCSPPLSPLSPTVEGGDGLSQLTALVKKGEKKAMFSQGMPPQIRRSVSHSCLAMDRWNC